MNFDRNRRRSAVKKELLAVEKQEKKLEKAALKTKPAGWKIALESKIPYKVYSGLESAFCKGFAAVFEQGRFLIEKSYSRENLQADHAIRDYAVQIRGRRKELRQMQKGAGRSNFINLSVTSLEGIALGALGVGMPDIVIFLSVLLKAVYETALNYGFDYESRQEQLLILKMMEASLSTGEDWIRLDAEVDALFSVDEALVSGEEFDAQLRACSSAFAVDMLLLKFVQGLPVIGVLGGAANPVYYNKVMKYVGLKYRKHYLLRQQKKTYSKSLRPT